MTIGQTTVKLRTILEHSVRRLGLPAEAQTPEIIQVAKNNLFFIMSNLANRGINFWCLDEQFVTLETGKARNTMPDGTVDVLNVNFRTTTATSGTDTSDATTFVREFSSSTDTVLIKLDSSTSATITISYSTDGSSYTTHSTIAHDGTTKWYALDPMISDVYLKLSVSTGTLSITELITVSSYTDVPLYRMNRDDYMSLPNKSSTGRPAQFWFDRQLTPVMVLWPTPSGAHVDNCVQMYRKHHIADVGALNEELDIPYRWMEHMIWALARNIGVEIPGVQPDRIQMATQMADKTLVEAELEERDNSPSSFVPNIGVYTA